MAHWTKIRNDKTAVFRTILHHGEVGGYVAKFEHAGLPEVCYWIGREFWGKGIATAALMELLAELPLRPLYARAAKDNVASIRVLEKCGFTISGYERTFAKARGEEIDETLLALE